MNKRAWKGEIPVQFLYTAGVAGERFFTSLRDQGKLFGTRCPQCKTIFLPPRIFCERCFSGLEDWVEVKGRGRVYSYTVLHRDRKGQPLIKPIIVAMVSFDGVKGSLIHFVAGVEPNKMKIGMEVEAVFKDPSERKGSILDIKEFHAVPKG